MFYVIEYEVVAFIALAFVTLKYFYSKHFPSQQNKIFGYLIVFSVMTLFLDLVTAFTISYASVVPIWINQVLNTLYFCIQTLNPPLFFLYTLSLTGKFNLLNKKLRRFFIPSIIAIVLLIIYNPISGVFFSFDSINGYTYGPWFFALHITALLYLILTFSYTILFKDKLTKVQYRTIIFFIIAIIITMILQIRFHRYLITGVILSFGAITMYFTLQNPQQLKDVLTGSFNYNAMLEYLSELLKSKQKFHLIAININDLARINRMFGLKNGNLVLNNVSSYITHLTKETWIFRMKGTRFVAIIHSDDAYYRFKSLIEKRIDSPWDIDSNSIFVSISVCSMFKLNNYVNTIDDVVNFIETSFIQTDSNGLKKRIISSDDGLYSELARMMSVESALRNALDSGIGLKLYFQPIYSIKNKQFTSAEVLLRLNDPVLGAISPAEFVPIAEKNGLVLQLDLLVVEKVCEFIVKYNPKVNFGFEYLSINLSAAEFMNTHMPTRMTELLHQFKIDPEFLIFEITETVATVSYEIVSSCMNEYRSFGFRFALDDFGTGYANLSQVVGLPFSIVKIDRELLSGSKIVLEDLLRMFKRLGLITIIEGIETLEQSDSIQAMNVDYIQGYYYATPLDEDSFIEFIKNSK